MPHVRRFNNLGVLTLIFLLSATACIGIGGSGKGVNSIDNESVVNLEQDVDFLTDEEITTLFTSCMRDQGFNIPDPVMNDDGTINLNDLKLNIAEEPIYETQGKKALSQCLPLLEGATFATNKSPEDDIEFQDRLLKFTQCLRDNGIDVPDPDFSDGRREGNIKTVLEEITGSDSKIQKNVENCNKQIFVNSKP